MDAKAVLQQKFHTYRHPAPPGPLPDFRWASGMHPDTYIIDVNGNPVAEPNLERRREWFARHKNRLVRRSYITKDIYVSTAFLGIDYNHSGLPAGAAGNEGFRWTARRLSAPIQQPPRLLKALLQPLRSPGADFLTFRSSPVESIMVSYPRIRR
jgi:hypothetical protein